MDSGDRLGNSLRDVIELEEFSHAFIGALTKRQLKPGQDVTPLVGELGLKLPEALKDAPIVWVGRNGSPDAADRNLEHTLVLMRPGQADAVGLTIGCIKIRHWRICLECGFWYCRIVIKY